MADPTNRLLELDERHNQLLEQLAALDRQASMILDDWTKAKQRDQAVLFDAVLASESQEMTVQNEQASEQAARAA